jgi:hypothetical protein
VNVTVQAASAAGATSPNNRAWRNKPRLDSDVTDRPGSGSSSRSSTWQHDGGGDAILWDGGVCVSIVWQFYLQ